MLADFWGYSPSHGSGTALIAFPRNTDQERPVLTGGGLPVKPVRHYSISATENHYDGYFESKAPLWSRIKEAPAKGRQCSTL